MGGFIVLEDGRAYSAASWAWSYAVRQVGEALVEAGVALPLARWLIIFSDRPGGLNDLHLMALTPKNREFFHMGIRLAIDRVEAAGPGSWSSPEFYAGWLKSFRTLPLMKESILRGEPPMALNPGMSGPVKPPEDICGPGWLEYLSGHQTELTSKLVRFERPVTHADFSGTEIRSDLLGSLRMLTRLETLDLSETDLEFPYLELLREHPSLKRVIAHHVIARTGGLPAIRQAFPFKIICEASAP